MKLPVSFVISFIIVSFSERILAFDAVQLNITSPLYTYSQRFFFSDTTIYTGLISGYLAFVSTYPLTQTRIIYDRNDLDFLTCDTTLGIPSWIFSDMSVFGFLLRALLAAKKGNFPSPGLQDMVVQVYSYLVLRLLIIIPFSVVIVDWSVDYM